MIVLFNSQRRTPVTPLLVRSADLAKFAITTVLFANMLLVTHPMIAAAVSYSVTDLGTLGGVISEAFGINNAGQVTGGASTADGQFHAFLYDGTIHDLGWLGGSSIGMAINSHGQVTGSSFTGTSQTSRHAFLY